MGREREDGSRTETEKKDNSEGTAQPSTSLAISPVILSAKLGHTLKMLGQAAQPFFIKHLTLFYP